MISNSASNSILKSSSGSSLNGADPINTTSHNTRTQTPSSFDSSIESSNTGANYGKKCYICEKSFILRKKNLCKSCNNYVCNEHYNKLFAQDKICDFCDRKNAKLEVRIEIEKELDILALELKKTKENFNRLDRVYCEKITEVSVLEQEFDKNKEYHEEKKLLLKARLANEKERAEKNLQNLENSQKILEETQIANAEMSKKYEKVEKDLNELTTDLIIIGNLNTELREKVQKNKKITESKIPIQTLKEKLCKKCCETIKI